MIEILQLLSFSIEDGVGFAEGSLLLQSLHLFLLFLVLKLGLLDVFLIGGPGLGRHLQLKGLSLLGCHRSYHFLEFLDKRFSTSLSCCSSGLMLFITSSRILNQVRTTFRFFVEVRLRARHT